MVMQAQSTTKSKLQAFFIFSFVEGYVFGFRLQEKKLTVTTGNIVVGGSHQDWVHSLSFPSLQHQRQILQELYKRKLNSTKQFSHRCGVTGPPVFN
jgi:hypothetical protein